MAAVAAVAAVYNNTSPVASFTRKTLTLIFWQWPEAPPN